MRSDALLNILARLICWAFEACALMLLVMVFIMLTPYALVKWAYARSETCG